MESLLDAVIYLEFVLEKDLRPWQSGPDVLLLHLSKLKLRQSQNPTLEANEHSGRGPNYRINIHSMAAFKCGRNYRAHRHLIRRQFFF